MTRSLLAGIVLAVCAPLALPLTAEAQLGGLIKKKVTEAIKKPAEPAKAEEKKPPGSEGSSQPGFNSDVLEITQPAFDAVIRGLNAELKLQDAFRLVLAKYPTPQEYEACKAHAAQTPEGAKIMSEFTNMPENVSAEEAQRRMQAMSTGMEALMKKQCPNDPDDWNPYKRKQKLEAIHEQAAEAAGMAASTASLPDDKGSFIRAGFEGEPFIFRGGRLAFLTGRQYDILGERIERGCTLTERPPGGVKVPGIGNNVYWVFTGGELGVLTPANCARYSDLSKRLMK
jgi:hypothetical protein